MLVRTAFSRPTDFVEHDAALPGNVIDCIRSTLDHFNAPAYLFDHQGRVLARNGEAGSVGSSALNSERLRSAIRRACARAKIDHVDPDDGTDQIVSLLPLSEVMPAKSVELAHPEAYCIGLFHRVAQTQRS